MLYIIGTVYCTCTLYIRVYISTFVNRSRGNLDVMTGSIVRRFPNVTSGMYRAHTTCAHANTKRLFEFMV